MFNNKESEFARRGRNMASDIVFGNLFCLKMAIITVFLWNLLEPISGWIFKGVALVGAWYILATLINKHLAKK